MTIEYTACGHIADCQTWWEKLKVDNCRCGHCQSMGLFKLLLDARGWLDKEEEDDEI